MENNESVDKLLQQDTKGKYISKKAKAIKIYCLNPSITISGLASEIGVSPHTMSKWLHETEFIDQVYKKYMEISGLELPNVVGAMIREAKTGNVQAGRLVLEHFGKLENKIKIQVESPFEKFIRAKEVKVNSSIVEAEFTEDNLLKEETEELYEQEVTNNEVFIDRLNNNYEDTISTLPDRDPQSQAKRLSKEKKAVTYVTQKAKSYAEINKDARERRLLRQRAEDVGLPLLKSKGRPRASERKRWLKELEKLEIEMFGEVQNFLEDS